jgi:hypothetical protein
VNSTRVPIIGRRQQTLANFLIDIETKDLHNAQVLLNKLDENNPILLDLDLQTVCLYLNKFIVLMFIVLSKQ